jgi:hypothetical protein
VRRFTQQFAALGLLVVMLLALYTVAIEPMFATHMAQRSDLSNAQFELKKLERLASQAPAWKARRDALVRSLGEHPQVFVGARPAAIEARVQGQVKKMLSGTGGRLVSARPLPVRTHEDYTLVSLDVAVQVPTAGLQKLLRAIETAQPVLAIEEFSVDAPSQRRSRSRRTEPRLRARIRVRAIVVSDS